jgi:maleylpyruvate isomerase
MTALDDWLAFGTHTLLTALDKLTDDELDEPSALPGWSRRHVVAHVHGNAKALCRLVAWADTGIEQPMYASAEARAREIEEGARVPAPELRDLVAGSAARLADDLAQLPPDARMREVVTAQGRTIRAEEIRWLRVREVAVHAVDLEAGVGFDDLPADLLEALLVDVVRKRAHGGEGPVLGAWLTGRSPEPPSLGRWL